MLKEVPGLPTATRSVCNRRGTGWGTIPARRNPAQGRNDGLLNGVTFNSRRSQNEMVLFSATVPLVAQPGLAPSPVSSTGQALRQERRWGLPGFPTPRPGRAGFKPAPTEPRYVVWSGTRESPSPQPSPVEGEGVRAPISISPPPNGGRGGSPLPVRPSGFRPRIEYGAGFSPE